MKPSAYIIAIIIMAFGIMAFSSGGGKNKLSILYTGGPPPGYSGDPKSGERNCSSCHSGSEVQNQPGWITSNIPAEGYVPDSSYTITATAIGIGHSKFGFQISPQDTLGNFLGTLVNTETTTQLSSNPNYIIQTSAGTAGTDSLSWTFDWTAPAEGSGEINFYGAFNLANGDGSTDGDMIKLSSLSIKEIIASIPEVSENGQKVSVYPNPASTYVTIDVVSSLMGSYYHVIDQAGRLVLKGQINTESTTLDINHLGTGVYFIQVGTEAKTSIKVVKN